MFPNTIPYAKEASTGEEAGSSTIDVLLSHLCVCPAYFYFFHFWKKQKNKMAAACRQTSSS